MAATVLDILNEARVDLGDKKPTKGSPTYSDDRLLRKLNDFGSQIKAIGKDRKAATDITLISGTASYSFPATYWFPVAARYKDSDNYLPVTILRGSNTHDIDYLSGENTGAPRFIFILDDKIYVSPTPDKTYYLNIEMVEHFTKITSSADLFSVHFDPSYESYAIDYIVMETPKKSDTLSKDTRKVFYSRDEAWDRIKRLEGMKYTPFNAKTRRTDGVKGTNRLPDYSRA